jgi:hypothetical protein
MSTGKSCPKDQELPEGQERLEHGSPDAEPVAGGAGRQLKGEGTAHDRATSQTVQEGVLDRDLHIPQPGPPAGVCRVDRDNVGIAGRQVLEAKGQPHLDLALGAEPTLVDERVDHGTRPFGPDPELVDEFVLRKGLLGDEGPREVQLPARP